MTHDLTNRKSQVNLHRWLAEVLLREAGGGGGGGGGGVGRTRSSPLVEDFDAENFGGFAQVYGLKKVVMVFFFFIYFFYLWGFVFICSGLFFLFFFFLSFSIVCVLSVLVLLLFLFFLVGFFTLLFFNL